MFVLCFEPNGDCWDATLFIEVGFGDMVPSRSFLGYEESLFGKMQVLHCVINCTYQMRTTHTCSQMLVCVTYCAMGLALLAMCMSLIQV